jgi:hypothetical protein
MPGKPPTLIHLGKRQGVCLTEEQLDRVAAAYNNPLSPSVRNEIRKTTAFFTAQMSEGEKTIELRDLQKKLQRLESIAQSLKEDLGSGHRRADPVIAFLRQRFNNPPLKVIGSDNFILANLSEMLDQVLKVCAEAEELSGSVRQIDWDAWVCSLDLIAKEAELPCGVNKSTKITAGEASPFVLLIDALQSEIPKKYWRQQAPISLDSLATAIVRAKRTIETV